MVFNIDDLVLELNGHIVEGGFSEDADAIMFEPIELVGDPRVGADGSVAFFASGNKGGTFTLKLLPNSPSIPFFIQQANVVRDGGSVTWQGSLRDVRRGISVQFRIGALMSFMPFPSSGKASASNYEFPFYFGEIIPSYEAATAAAFVTQ